MMFLDDVESFECEPSTENLQMSVGEGGVIAGQSGVHRRFDSWADNTVEEERRDRGGNRDERDERDEAERDPASPATARA